MNYSFALFGHPSLRLGSTTVPLRSRKGQALLWYLASHPDEAFPRDFLRSFLWDDVSHQRARQDFNTMFSRLRRKLPVPFIVSTSDQLQWNTEANTFVDVQQFAQLTASIQTLESATAAHAPKSARAVNRDDLYRALELYTGPFLDGFSCASETYEQWIAAMRLQWETRIVHVLDKLLSIESNADAWERVIHLTQRALDISPWEERFHRAAMRAYVQQGRRAAAIAHFDMCRSMLQEQLGIEPDAMTQALYDEIKQAGSFPSIYSEDADVAATPILLPANNRLLTPPTHPLIGRQQELDHIQTVLEEIVAGGQNHSVLLSGEAGIGKTRLLAEIIGASANHSRKDPGYGTLLIGGAYETMAGVPYGIFIEALEGIMRDLDFCALNIPDIFLRELSRLLPEIHTARPDLGVPGPVASGDDRLRLFQAVSRFLASLPQPVLLALEDLQWADSLSLALLAYLIRSAPSQLKLGAVVTVRTGDETDATRLTFHTLARERMLTRLELDNLKDADTAALVERLFPEGDTQYGPRIFAQTHGHPLYTVELAMMLREAARSEGPELGTSGRRTAKVQETLDTPSGFDPLPIPPTVREAFIGRLTRLGSTAGAIAEALAIFRHEADVPQLEQVAAISEAKTVSGLHALITARIVVENHRDTVAFSHDVFRQVVLEKMSKTRRSYLHRQAYDVLSKHVPSPIFADSTTDTRRQSESPRIVVGQPQQFADLIEHAACGRLWDEAVIWAREAAAMAHRLTALPTAVEKLGEALMYLTHLPDTAERRKQALDIELDIATLDYWSDPAERDGRLARMTERAVAEGATSLLPRIQLAQATSYIAQGRCPEARLILQDLAPLAVDESSLAMHLDAWHGTIAFVTGDVKRALVHFDRASEAGEDNADNTGTSLQVGSAACYAALGQFDKADAILADVAQIEKAQGYTQLTGTFFTTAATVEFCRGDWRKAEEYARRGLHTARAAEDAYNETISGLWLGAASVEMGETKTAIPILEEALTASQRAQSYLRRDVIYAYLASASIEEGKFDRADAYLATGQELAKRFDYKEGHALCIEMQGRLAARRGDVGLAKTLMERALHQYEDFSLLPNAERCRRNLAALG